MDSGLLYPSQMSRTYKTAQYRDRNLKFVSHRPLFYVFPLLLFTVVRISAIGFTDSETGVVETGVVACPSRS